MMSTNVLSPVSPGSGLMFPYPLSPLSTESGSYLLRKRMPPKKEDYVCRKCMGTGRTRLNAMKLYEYDIVYGFDCAGCNISWYITAQDAPKKLRIGPIMSDQMSRLKMMTESTKHEFGALIMRDGRELELSFFSMGKDKEIELEPTRELKPREEILGSFHVHPTQDLPSPADMSSYLLSDWERVSVVYGAQGTVWLFIKTNDTLRPKPDVILTKYQDATPEQIATRFRSLLYKGKDIDGDLNLVVGESEKRKGRLVDLLGTIKGTKELDIKTKKGDYTDYVPYVNFPIPKPKNRGNIPLQIAI